MVKRKRTQDLQPPAEKRRHLYPEDEGDEEFISDDGMRFDGEDQVSTGDAEDSNAEDEGSEAEDGEDEDVSDVGGADSTAQDAEDGKHSGTKPKKPPTGEELRNIKDATDLYRSSSFKLQIDALLPNVRPKYSKYAPLDRFLLALHTFLTSLSPIEPDHPLSAARSLQKKGIAVPYPAPAPTDDTNWKVAFEKPSDIAIVGSWVTKLSVKAQDKRPYRVDLAVEMPSELFQEKDYLNGRFFHKRAYYLSVIAAALTAKKSGLKVDLAFESAMGDTRLTNLIIRSRADGSDRDFSKLPAEVRLIPTLAPSFPLQLSRLSPGRGNIRTASASTSEAKDAPTPTYNSALLLATTAKAHLLRVYELQKAVPAFSDALTMLRVWANQRGYGEGGEGKLSVRGFEGRGYWWAAVLDLLINGEEPPPAARLAKTTKRKPLGKGLSSYQLFRAALDFFVKTDFSTEHIFVRTANGQHRFPPAEYDGCEPVFIDHTSSVNLLAGMPLGSLAMLAHDAKLTLETLNDTALSPAQDPFAETFLQDKRDLQTRFDVVLRVDLSHAKLLKPSTHKTLDAGSPYNALLATLESTVRAGLGNRSKAIAILHPSSSTRSLSQPQPTASPIVYIGFILDTEHAFRLVDHGPPAGETETEEMRQFRELWGEKAELRRFKDGSITESVVWDVRNADERAQIPFFVARYLLQRHCGIPETDVRAWQGDFDGILRVPQELGNLYQSAGTQMGFKAAMTAFDQLVKNIKALDDQLPLAVLNVSPVSESLRYTNVFVPVAINSKLEGTLPTSARYLPSMDIIVEFEKSGRWPDDLRAIQKIKLAFFETLGSALMSSVPGLRASVVLADPHASDIEDAATLELVTPDGWAFSARIWHDREATLLDTLIDDKPHLPKRVKKNLARMNAENGTGPDPRLRAQAMHAKDVYTRRFIHAPRHHRAVAALSHRFTAFAGTVRLVKRWLAAHWLLRAHVTEEAVELLCAHVFLGAARTAKDRESVPATKERGFALVVRFLRNWEWNKGLFVPLYGDEKADDEGAEKPEVEVKAGERQGVWAISTEFDKDGHMWTAQSPDAIVARRVQAVARASWAALREIENPEFDAKTLFVHPTEHYDFLVRLDHAALPRYHHNVAADASAIFGKSGKYANNRLAVASGESAGPLRPGFDPAQLLFDDLKRVYHDTFKIFCDPFGGDVYGAVWDPSLQEPRPFRVLGGFNSHPVQKDNVKSKDKGLVALNSDAVLTEIERMGSGIIKGTTVQM